MGDVRCGLEGMGEKWGMCEVNGGVGGGCDGQGECVSDRMRCGSWEWAKCTC